MKSVAIVGFADSKKDCPKDIEVWGLNEFAPELPRLDRWFQIHDRQRVTKNNEKDPKHLKKLKSSKCSVYMQEKFEDIPNSVKYPLEEMQKKYGNMFASTFDYMMALAIEEGYEDIRLYGIDMAIHGEYAHQRPTALFWIGIARGKGIDVWVHPDSGIVVNKLYGFDVHDVQAETEALIQEVHKIRAYQLSIVEEFNYTKGMLQAVENIEVNKDMDIEDAKKTLSRALLGLKEEAAKADKKKGDLIIALSIINGSRVITKPPDIIFTESEILKEMGIGVKIVH